MASNAKNLAELLNTDSTVAAVDVADGSITTAKLADDAVTSAKLGASSVDATAIASNAVTTAKVADGAVTQVKTTSVGSGKNHFRNGNMAIAQRNPNSTGVYTGGIWKVLCLDGWNGHFDNSPSGALHGQFGGGPNSRNTMLAEVRGPNSGGNGNGYFGQRIERDNMHNLLATNSITVSGYLRRENNIGSSVSVNILCPTAKDNYSSYTTHGGVFNTMTISGNGTTGTSSVGLTTAGTWYFFTATKTSFSSLTNIGNGLHIYFAFSGASSTSDKLQFTQMKLEAGTSATDFIPNTFEEDLNECKRYYQKSFDYASAPANGGNATSVSYAGALLGYSGTNNSGTLTDNWLFSPEMRATPTVTRYGNSSGHWGRMSMPNSSVTYDNGAGYISGTRTTGLNFGQNVSANTHICGFGHAVADAEL